jgi:hypothetical protein
MAVISWETVIISGIASFAAASAAGIITLRVSTAGRTRDARVHVYVEQLPLVHDKVAEHAKSAVRTGETQGPHDVQREYPKLVRAATSASGKDLDGSIRRGRNSIELLKYRRGGTPPNRTPTSGSRQCGDWRLNRLSFGGT